jgi:hypothetical protein
VESAAAELAADAAMRAFKRSRPGLRLPEIADFHLERVED